VSWRERERVKDGNTEQRLSRLYCLLCVECDALWKLTKLWQVVDGQRLFRFLSRLVGNFIFVTSGCVEVCQTAMSDASSNSSSNFFIEFLHRIPSSNSFIQLLIQLLIELLIEFLIEFPNGLGRCRFDLFVWRQLGGGISRALWRDDSRFPAYLCSCCAYSSSHASYPLFKNRLT